MLRQHSSNRVIRLCTNQLSKSSTSMQYNVNDNETAATASATNSISSSSNSTEAKQQQEHITQRLEFEQYSPYNPYAPFAQQQQQQYYSSYFVGQQYLQPPYYTSRLYTTHQPHVPFYNQYTHTTQFYYTTSSSSNTAASALNEQGAVQLETPKSTTIVIKKPVSSSPSSQSSANNLFTERNAALEKELRKQERQQQSTIRAAQIVERKISLEKEKELVKLERERLSAIRTASNNRFKSYLTSLPDFDYPSHYQVECVGTMAEANVKLEQLVKEDKTKMFGLDLEWPPCFVKGQKENKVSLVQICSAKRILLIQLSRINGIPHELKRFFLDKTCLKSGVNIAADGLKLQRDFGLITNGLVELRDLVDITTSPKKDITHLRSLRTLTGLFMEQHMPKGKVRTSNWARSDLTAQQIKYAAQDAYASYKLFVILDELRDKQKSFKIRHLAEENVPQTKEQKKQQRDHYIHNNKASPTQTVQIVQPKIPLSSSISNNNNRSSPSPLPSPPSSSFIKTSKKKKE